MTAQEMHMELKEFAQSGEIDNNDIPQVSTIQNWIGRYSREFYYERTLIDLRYSMLMALPQMLDQKSFGSSMCCGIEIFST
ncbi:1905_t:CDS:2, partial [Cetraspora pellucida]